MSIERPIIRTVVPGDAPRVAQLIEESRRVAKFPIGPQWSVAQVAEECGKSGWGIIGQSGELDAFILFRDGEPALEITYLATALNARGQGRMSCLLQHMIDHKPESKAIWLEVHEANEAARRLYLKMGFREVGRRPRYYSDGGAATLYNYG